MPAVEIRLQGVEELEKLLNQLTPALRRKHWRRAIRRGISLVRDDIKQTAPVREPGTASKKRPKPGRLRRLVKIRPRRPKRGYLKISLFYPVLKELGTTNDPKNAFYWRFVVDGTRFMPANDFIRRSVDSKFNAVLIKVIAETNAGVREEIQKMKAAA